MANLCSNHEMADMLSSTGKSVDLLQKQPLSCLYHETYQDHDKFYWQINLYAIV